MKYISIFLTVLIITLVKANQSKDFMDDKVTVASLKELVKKFVQERDWEQFHSPKNVSMGLAIEAAELMELFLYSDEQDSYKRVVDKRQDIEDELADVLHWVLIFSYRNDIDLSSALENKLKKNAQKYPVEKSKGNYAKYTKLNKK